MLKMMKTSQSIRKWQFNKTDPFNMRKLLFFGFLWKLLLISIAILARFLLNDFDTSADLLPPIASSTSCTPSLLTRSLLKWDAIHFLAIASKNAPFNSFYLFEHQFAFFPLLPLLCHYLCKALISSTATLCEFYDSLVLCGFLISLLSSLIAAALLYK